MVPREKHDEIRLLINSRHPLIAVETSEEQRVEGLLADVSSELKVPFFTWSVATGMRRHGLESAMYDTEDPLKVLASIRAMPGEGLYLLKDFCRYLDNDRVLRHVREIVASFRQARRSMVLSSPVLNVPAQLDDEVVPFHLELPGPDLLVKVVQQALAEAAPRGKPPSVLEPSLVRELARSLVGLTMEEARRTLAKCFLSHGKLDETLVVKVLEAKRASLRQEGILEYLKTDETLGEVAGFERLKAWLARRRNALSPEGREFGLEPPKGILVTGVQGCGKSLCAKAVAGEWRLQLARLDAGALYDKYVGESEKRLRKALELAEQLSPLVLWIDEIEKGFAATAGSADVDAGLSQRILGTLLTWLQDRKGGVFVVATSNDISRLPPELLRKGRFDEIFFVDLPGEKARAELFRIHLRRRGREPADFDLEALARASEGFSGAEVEQAVVSALYGAFERKIPLSTACVAEELASTRPLSVTRREAIAELRAWASERAVPAD